MRTLKPNGLTSHLNNIDQQKMGGLLADKNIVSKNPDKNDFVSRIKRNHAILGLKV